jgi:plasmid maintenance system antidote protein VapI
MGCEVEVTRVGSGWADVKVTQYRNGAHWTKRQPLPFPPDWQHLARGDGNGESLESADFTVHPGITWRQIIKDSGRTQTEVAVAMGSSAKHLSQIVNCSALPGLETTMAFARAMEVRPEMMWRLVCDHRLALAMGKNDLTGDYL